MADVAISGLTALGAAPATTDLLCVVDVSDTTQGATGTTKKMTVANLFTAPHMTSPQVDSGLLTFGGTSSGFVALKFSVGPILSVRTADDSAYATIQAQGILGSDLEVTGSVRTGAPSGGTAAVWKVGTFAAGSVALDTAHFIQVEIAGVVHKIGVVA